MGGFGSGRRVGRLCTDELRPLDVREIRRQGLLTPGRVAKWEWICDDRVIGSICLAVEHEVVILDYQHRLQHGEWESLRYAVRLDWTSCHYGGRRPWWLCPAVGCGQRVAVLYCDRIFACRRCHSLAYRCQRESEGDRAARRANKIRQRLRWKLGVLNRCGGKPKGMHGRTFAQLTSRHDAFVQRALLEVVTTLGLARDNVPEELFVDD